MSNARKARNTGNSNAPLESLSTEALRNRLRHINATPCWRFDCYPDETKGLMDEREALKAVLATREHLPNKKERREARKKLQLSRQNR